MIRQTSDLSTEALCSAWVEQLELRMSAVRAIDVPKANRHHRKAAQLAKALASTLEGRAAIQRLLSHPKLHIQLSAAELMMGWNPDGVIPRLGKMLDQDLSDLDSPDERIDIRDRAKGQLYNHFNIRSSDRNDLIKPLAMYGVHLSYRRRH